LLSQSEKIGSGCSKIPSFAKRDVRHYVPDREIFNNKTVFGLNFVMLGKVLKNPLGCECSLSPLIKGINSPTPYTLK
jgi:hypothetical protein